MSTARAIAVGWCLALSAVGAGPEKTTVSPRDAEFFERRIRPILAENCVSCHGPEKQKSGLRLDSRPGMLKGSESGPVIMPGDPDDSPLIEAVRRTGANPMPPKKPLQPDAVSDLTTWVKMGAPWPESAATRAVEASAAAWKKHWAFQPVRDPVPPAIRQRDWPKTSVDTFILAALEAKGLEPSRTADRRTLIRRATFDLIGLPPRPEEVDAFIADDSPDGFAKVVDRLLASPRYGERWGRYWLDVARYADTKGYVFFEDANFTWAYTYRDYVIRAFNEDRPYNQFVIEQLAADRLALGADKRALTAMGFLTLGGRFMSNPHDIIDDRIDVVTRGLLGLTVTCARCHDHKFDPIPAKDYYALYGVFASSVEPNIPPVFADPPQTEEYAAFETELRKREQALEDYLAFKHRELVQGARTRASEYLLAAQASLGQPTVEEFMLIADGDDLNPTMIVRWRSLLERTRKRHHPVFAPWHSLAALPDRDFPARALAYCTQLRDHPDRTRPINALILQELLSTPPRSMADVGRIYAKLLSGSEKAWRELAVRTALNRSGAAVIPLPALEELSQVYRDQDSPPNLPPENSGSQLALLPDRPSQARFQELRKAVETWRATGPGAPPRAMTLEDAPEPIEPRVFIRGNPNNLGEPAPRRFLSALAGEVRPTFHDGSGRVELARAIASQDNPLTARVLVNRVWMHHFGTPLVRTPSDFGLRSETPSHPALLDHLASSFMMSGWSIKALHRRIMLSSTYQQESNDRDDGLKTDPENALLWKYPRRRLDFEALRDALLAVSGRLSGQIGGPSVNDLTGPTSTRRTVYGFIDRLNLPGLYRTFDFPDPNATSPKRDGTTVAPQALFLMNNPFVITAAKELLKRPEVNPLTDVEQRVSGLYRVLYLREPDRDEMSAAHGYLATNNYSATGWERLAQALMLANEFAFVD
jgi:mono/diheme cytochrome c family protein